MARPSFFYEERVRNRRPNFYETMSAMELERNVKRIVKDVATGNIEEVDLQYFKNNKVLTACLKVSAEEAMKEYCIATASSFYATQITSGKLVQNYTVYTADQELSCCINNANQAQIRYRIWSTANFAFRSISYGADVAQSLMAINGIAKQFINML